MAPFTNPKRPPQPFTMARKISPKTARLCTKTADIKVLNPKVYSTTMRRGARDHSLGIWDILQNRRISEKRAPGEWHYAVISCIFQATYVFVTTL